MQINRLLTTLQFIERYTIRFTLILSFGGGLIYGYRTIRPAWLALAAEHKRALAGNVAWDGITPTPHVTIFGRTPTEAWEAIRPFLIDLGLIVAISFALSFTVSLTFLLWRKRVVIRRGAVVLTSRAMRSHLIRLRRTRGHQLSVAPKHTPKGLFSRFPIGTVPFPMHYENLSIVGFGSPGVGKSVWLHQALRGSLPGYRRGRDGQNKPHPRLIKRPRDLTFATLTNHEAWPVAIAIVLNIFAACAYPFAAWQHAFALLSQVVTYAVLVAPPALLAATCLWARLCPIVDRYPGIIGDGGFIYDRADLMKTLYNRRAPHTAPDGTVHYPDADLIFDPWDKRSIRWNIFNDLCPSLLVQKDGTAVLRSGEPAIQAFVEGFYPLPPKGEPFWAEASRSLLKIIIMFTIAQKKKLAKQLHGNPTLAQERPTMQDLADTILETTRSPDHLRLLGATYPQTYAPIAEMLGEPGSKLSPMASSVFATFKQSVQTFTHPIWTTPPGPNDGDGLSVHAFVDQLKDPTTKPRRFLFLRNQATNEASNRPVYTALLNMVFRYIISAEDPREYPRIVFVIDEWGSLAQLTQLTNLLAEGRKYGTTVIALTQTPEQIVDVYGPHRANVLFSNLATKIIFRPNDEETANRFVKMIGKQEKEEHTTSVQMNELNLQGSLSNNQQIKIEDTRFASEIMALEPFHCLVLYPAQPWFKTIVPEHFYEPITPDIKLTEPTPFRDEILGDIGALYDPGTGLPLHPASPGTPEIRNAEFAPAIETPERPHAPEDPDRAGHDDPDAALPERSFPEVVS